MRTLHRDRCKGAAAGGQFSVLRLSWLLAMLSLPCCLTQADGLCHRGRAGGGALQHSGAARVAGRSRVSGAWAVTMTLRRVTEEELCLWGSALPGASQPVCKGMCAHADC